MKKYTSREGIANFSISAVVLAFIDTKEVAFLTTADKPQGLLIKSPVPTIARRKKTIEKNIKYKKFLITFLLRVQIVRISQVQV